MANNTENSRFPTRLIVFVAACVVAFGVFMAIRSEFEQFWVRAAIAGCAGAFLGLALAQAKKLWSRRK